MNSPLLGTADLFAYLYFQWFTSYKLVKIVTFFRLEDLLHDTLSRNELFKHLCEPVLQIQKSKIDQKMQFQWIICKLNFTTTVIFFVVDSGNVTGGYGKMDPSKIRAYEFYFKNSDSSESQP